MEAWFERNRRRRTGGEGEKKQAGRGINCGGWRGSLRKEERATPSGSDADEASARQVEPPSRSQNSGCRATARGGA